MEQALAREQRGGVVYLKLEDTIYIISIHIYNYLPIIYAIHT